MKIEIDQSGKIEQTHTDTCIGLSNDIEIGIKISRSIKRTLLKEFRASQKQKFFPQIVFAYGVARVLVMYGKPYKVIIDKEYDKHEGLISKWIYVFVKKMSPDYSPIFRFSTIGKSSNAHDLCQKIARKKFKSTKVIRIDEIMSLLEDYLA